jgi:hypothetical protein
MIKDYNNGPNEWATEASAATSKIDFMGLTYAGRKSAGMPAKTAPLRVHKNATSTAQNSHYPLITVSDRLHASSS